MTYTSFVVGFVAIIIPTRMVGQIMRMYFSTRMRLSREIRAFFSQDEALQRLLNKLNADHASHSPA
ncbi:MAG: hypothetical protein KF716_02300 [Anaerolineae bacterium]|nr:hypothetical protein [Anaerolineae bacterium]